MVEHNLLVLINLKTNVFCLLINKLKYLMLIIY